MSLINPRKQDYYAFVNRTDLTCGEVIRVKRGREEVALLFDVVVDMINGHSMEYPLTEWNDQLVDFRIIRSQRGSYVLVNSNLPEPHTCDEKLKSVNPLAPQRSSWRRVYVYPTADPVQFPALNPVLQFENGRTVLRFRFIADVAPKNNYQVPYRPEIAPSVPATRAFSSALAGTSGLQYTSSRQQPAQSSVRPVGQHPHYQHASQVAQFRSPNPHGQHYEPHPQQLQQQQQQQQAQKEEYLYENQYYNANGKRYQYRFH